MEGLANRNVIAIVKSLQEGIQGPTGVLLSYASNLPASLITPAGYQLLKPIGYGYQLVDCSIQTIGGNAGGANVSIVGTSFIGNPFTFCTFAPAGLLQNTLLRMGDPNTTISSQSLIFSGPGTNIRIIESGGGVTGNVSFYIRMSYFLIKR